MKQPLTVVRPVANMFMSDEDCQRGRGQMYWILESKQTYLCVEIEAEDGSISKARFQVSDRVLFEEFQLSSLPCRGSLPPMHGEKS